VTFISLHYYSVSRLKTRDLLQSVTHLACGPGLAPGHHILRWLGCPERQTRGKPLFRGEDALSHCSLNTCITQRLHLRMRLKDPWSLGVAVHVPISAITSATEVYTMYTVVKSKYKYSAGDY